MKIKHLTLLLLPGIWFILSHCNGQVKRPNTVEKKSFAQKAIGQVVNQPDLEAKVIYRDKQKNLWLASKTKGIYRYDGKQLVLFTSVDGVCSNQILSVQEDQQGNLYFDTPEGICKYDGQTFTKLKITPNIATENEWKLTPGDLWFRMGWGSNGPLRYDGKNLYQLTFPKNVQEAKFRKKYPRVSFNPYGIYFMFKDSQGRIWMGTSSLGLYMFDGKKIHWTHEKQWTETPGGGAFGIRSIAEDKAGNYWICNANYKYTLLPNQATNDSLQNINFKAQKGIPGHKDLYFLSIISDQKSGDLWMQTYESGLWRNNGKELKQVFINGNISPSSVYQDRQGNIWLGTDKQGIYQYDGNTFEKFEFK